MSSHLTTAQEQHWEDFFTWLDKKEVKKGRYALCTGQDRYCFEGLLCLYYSETTGLGGFDMSEPYGDNEYLYELNGAKSTTFLLQEVQLYFGLNICYKLFYKASSFFCLANLNDLTEATFDDIVKIVKQDILFRPIVEVKI